MPTSDRNKSPVHNAKDGEMYATLRRVVTTTYAQGNLFPLSKQSYPRGLKLTCISEYAGLVTLVVLYFLLRIFSEPFHQLFRLDDPRISFPHAEVEHVPVCMFRHQYSLNLSTSL